MMTISMSDSLVRGMHRNCVVSTNKLLSKFLSDRKTFWLLVCFKSEKPL